MTTLLENTAKEKRTLLDSLSDERIGLVNFDPSKALNLASETETPITTIEDFYDDVVREEAWFPADPQDIPLNDISPAKPIVGLVEQIRRMDSIDWMKRAPFSPVGAQQVALTLASTKRLSKGKYETIGDWKRKHAEFAQYTKYAEPIYEEEKRLAAPIQEYYLNLPDDELSPKGNKDFMQDVAIIEYYLEKQRQVQEDKTFVAKVFDAGSYLPGWMIEFALTGGLSKVGSAGAKEFVYKTLKGYAETRGGQVVLKTAGWTGGAITRASLGLSHRTIEATLQRQLPEKITIGPEGQYVFDMPEETWAMSILKGWGSVVIESASEEAGGAIVRSGKVAFSRLPFGGRIINAMQAKWMTLAPTNTAEKFVNKILTPAGYSSLLGELGEEWLETQLKAVFDIEDFGAGKDANMYEKMKAGLWQDFQSLPVTATTLAVPGAARYAAAKTIDVFRDEGETGQLTSDAAAFEAQEAAAQYVEDPPRADLPDEEIDITPTRELLNNYGIKSLDGYEPLADKDFREIYKFLQMPDDIRRTFPQFDPLYQLQRAREAQKASFDIHFAETTLPYFGLNKNDKAAVDKSLVESNMNPAFDYGPKKLKEMGLNDNQIKGFLAVRNSLDDAMNIISEQMKQAGIPEEQIEEFLSRNKNYIPHKWYGNWAVVVRQKIRKKPKRILTKKEMAQQATAFLQGEEIPEFEETKELKRPPTIFMTKTDYRDRFKERKRLQQLYPDTEVIIVKSNKLPYEAFQTAPSFAVSKMVDLAMEKAQTDPQSAAAIKEAMTDLYKSKGFGAHFIKRKNIPGYMENLANPLAEYFNGFSGYVSKLNFVQGLPDAVKPIKPNRTPNLYKYAIDYANYVTGDQYEFATAKNIAYYYYLYGNLKSAALNATQNFILGWPELAKQTNFALPKIMQAMARTAKGAFTKGESDFINELEKSGILDPQMTAEISGYHGNPIMKGVVGKGREAMSVLDLFRHVERFNRLSMAVALHQAGITDLKKVGEIIDNSHFHYGKGNRPTLMRGYLSPVMTFRSFPINYFTWLKNQIKAGEVPAVARSLSALVFFGGLSALPFFKPIAWMWRKIFKKDIEAEARGALGEIAGRLIMRGAPAQAVGVSFTGSVGFADILPTDLKEIGGVFADIPTRAYRISKDLKSKQYLRSLEDSSPEFLRNPLAAYRLYSDGQLTRNGRSLLDYETLQPLKISGLDATKKALGFQPIKLAENWDVSEILDTFETDRMAKKQQWADVMYLSFLNNDLDAFNDTIAEWQQYNSYLARKGLTPVSEDEINQMLNIRARPANIPPQFMWPALKEIRKKYWGIE